MIRRREFITLLGGAAAWPLAADAQQHQQMRRIGLVMSLGPDTPVGQARLVAFTQGLQQVGWTIGRNAQLDIRWNANDPDSAHKSAAELLALAPDVIVATGSSGLGSLLQITRGVPIVFVLVSDPVGAGFVSSLAHPGGNATGFMQFEYGLSTKWLELLKEIAPGIKRAAILRDPDVAAGIGQFSAIQAVAPSVGVEVIPVNVGGDASEMERAVMAFARSPNGGLIVTTSAVTQLHSNLIISLAGRASAF